jgi:hypothetical protein
VIIAASTDTTDNPLSGVKDFFNSGAWTAVLRLILFFFVALWLALVFWTFKDARRRISDPILIAVSVATALLFPYVGALIYMILRPPEYLEDIRERELEIRAMERRLGSELRCPYCRHTVQASFLVCPHCTNKLKSACRRCKSPLEPEWRVCPYCETSVQRATETVEI